MPPNEGQKLVDELLLKCQQLQSKTASSTARRLLAKGNTADVST